LRVFYGGPCCFEDLDIGAIASEGEDNVGPDPLNPSGATDFPYSACGKAKAIVDSIYLIVASGYSAVNEWPWQWISYVENTVGYDLDNNHLIGMFAEINAGLALDLGYGIGIEASDVNDPVERQRILCRVVDLFDDNAIGVPDSATFEAVKGCFKAEMWPLSLWWGMFEYAINALGRVDMDTIAKMGAAQIANCDCVADLTDPTGEWSGTWAHFWDLRGAALPAGIEIDQAGSIGFPTEHVPARGIVAYPEEGGNGYSFASAKIPHLSTPDGTTKLVDVWGLYKTPAGFSYAGGGFQISIGDQGAVVGTFHAGDTDPSAGGEFDCTVNFGAGLAFGGAFSSAKMEGYTPNSPAIGDKDARSPSIMAIAIGGIGKDPFVP